MPAAERSHSSQTIPRGKRGYPGQLEQRLGADAPATLTIIGPAAPLSGPLTALLCSKQAPGATILKAFDQAAAWRDSGRCVIGGFHSPLERQCLDILLRGKQPVVMVLARGLGVLRLPAMQRKALEDGRLTIVSPFPVTEKRVTADLARQRNRFVAALADEVVFAYIAPGGSLSKLSDEVAGWGGAIRRLHV
jgi:predicted Rossmann fold nucleotide-binding protein DprA/Smf involved in DNA uptake